MQRGSNLPGYTTREVARLLEIPPPRLRAWARAGYVTPRRGPGRRYRFDFQDLVVLRAAQGLLAARVPAPKVRRALARLRAELPRGRSLAALRISAEGSRIVVRHGDAAWEPETGQRVLDFGTAELAREAEPLAHRTAREARARAADLDAEDWFHLALELEAAAPGEAADAYGRALVLDRDHADAHLNLGRLLHEAGRVAEAERHYRAAEHQRPRDATAAFNLGVALQDLGHADAAIAAYRRAIAADPALADAFFNLAGLLDARGERAEALRQLKVYKVLVEG